jgi:type IV pilus assembly protein PilV
LLEVMMALAVMTIGGSALIGMQAMTARFNTFSRQSAIATDIAQTWAERLKLDAVSWNSGTTAANVDNIAVATTWLVDSTTFAVNVFGTPTVVQAAAAGVPMRSPAFDMYGRDVALGTAGVFYCVAYRFNTVVLAALGQPPALRVDIRVFWPREGLGVLPTCAPASAVDVVRFHSVGLPIVVRQGSLPANP